MVDFGPLPLLTGDSIPGGAIIVNSTGTPNWSYSNHHLELARRTLERNLQEVPFYRAWRQYDPGPDFAIERRYAALPALTKKDIREHFPHDLVPAGLDLDGALAAHEISLVDTSGTTDDKITNIWNQAWWDASERRSWEINRDMARIATGDHPEAILVNPKNVGIKSDEIDLPFDERRLARFL